jgi:hypothetical protein
MQGKGNNSCLSKKANQGKGNNSYLSKKTDQGKIGKYYFPYLGLSF